MNLWSYEVSCKYESRPDIHIVNAQNMHNQTHPTDGVDKCSSRRVMAAALPTQMIVLDMGITKLPGFL